MHRSTSHTTPITTGAPVLLSRAERMTRTAQCLEEAATKDEPTRQALIDEVVVLNMPVARSIAHRFQNKGISDDDLDQVAYLALTRAAQQYDGAYDRDFLSYCVPTIRGELKKYFRDAGWTVRPPRRVQELQGLIASAAEELAQTLGRAPRPSELAQELDEDVDRVIEALTTDGCFAPTSLDRPVTDDSGLTLGECIRAEEDGLGPAEARVMLGEVVRQLSERDRRILHLRFFRGATQQQIAADIGVTQMHVSRLISRILRELREQLTEEPEPAERTASDEAAS